MGAVAVTNVRRGASVGRFKVVEADVALSASYATGGDTLSPQALGLRAIHQILIPSHDLITGKPITVAAAGNRALSLGGTTTAPTVIARDAAGTEVVAATNVSTNVRRVRFLGY